MESNTSVPSGVKPNLWENTLDLFGYEEPRQTQLDGFKLIFQSVGENGFFLLEGPCGTGKTMLALPPLIALARSSTSNIERIIVSTSVKQQQRVFEEEIRKINENRSDNDKVSAVTLVGKPDVNPYARHGDIDSDIFRVDESLRENTRNIISAADNPKKKADELANLASSLETKEEWDDGSPDYPYPPSVPVNKNDTEFSPFYAKYISKSFEDSDMSTIPFDVYNSGIITADDLLRVAGRSGLDPHSVMKDVMEEVEVVIANYNHIFEPRTVSQITGSIISQESVLVCDEAHNLVHRVKDLLSDSLASTSIREAKKEIDLLQEIIDRDVSKLEAAKGVDLDKEWRKEQLGEDVLQEVSWAQSYISKEKTLPDSVTELVEYANLVDEMILNSEWGHNDIYNYNILFEEILDFLDRKVTGKLTDKYGEYWGPNNIDDNEEINIQIRDPEKVKQDELTQFLSLKQNLHLLSEIQEFGSFFTHIMELFYTEIRDDDDLKNFSIEATSRVLNEWYERDHCTFFRQITLEKSERKTSNGPEWEREFNTKLQLKNCLPSERVASRVDEFGGGIFMSATLEPIDIFKQVTGIEQIEDDRTVIKKKYGLNFPEPNRRSIAVNAPPFKKSNRGETRTVQGKPKLNETRRTYKNIVFDVIRETDGNTLITMPSYDEAKWIGELIKNEFQDRDVYVDESSSNEKTERLKENFFDSKQGILVTAARGTLVEGVDYHGNRLNSVVVCGVPLENHYEPYKKAIRTAYDEYFDDGFKYAFSVPAVQKSRQAIGRVIRSNDDKGVRLLVDERYTNGERWDSVQNIIPEEEWEEFEVTEPENVSAYVKAFWKYQKQNNGGEQ